MAKRTKLSPTGSQGGAPFSFKPVVGNGTQKGAGGYGVSQPGAKPATGQQPSSNPFIIPKEMGLTQTTQTFPSYYFVEWTLTSWRAACEQVMRMGWPIAYSTLTTWAFTSSPFIQSLFTKLGRALDKIPFFVTDAKGNQLPEISLELCGKPWHMQLRQEIMFAYFWGFTGLNFDPIAGKIYKYPQQELDPINRMLRSSTFAFYDGVRFEDNDNLLFVQPSTNVESFLGWMQPITRKFIQTNLNDNNWIAAGTRLAFPLITVGYPQDDSTGDSDNPVNRYKLEAVDIARNISPLEAQVYPYTINNNGDVIKSAMVEFESPKTSSNQHLIFKDFNADARSEIEQMVFGRAMTQGSSKGGNRALGEVEERALDDTIAGLVPYILAVLNSDYHSKIEKFYNGLPKGWQFGYDTSKQLTIADIASLSTVVTANGYRLTGSFFENNGLSKDDFEEAPEPVAEKPPQIDASLQMAALKKKSFWGLNIQN